MKITYRVSYGMGTVINPTFRRYDYEQTIICARFVEMGNLVQLYNFSGYTICAIAKENIIKIEN